MICLQQEIYKCSILATDARTLLMSMGEDV